MSDHDRGAYTPQTDPPLAFDPRRPSERRPLPMALIGSAVVLVVLLAGVAMVYRGGVRQAGESPRPVGEPVMAVKTAPTPAQTAAANAVAPSAADVYTPAPANQTAEAPTLAPAPEQPAARPGPSPATVALLNKPPAPDHVERPAPTATIPAAVPPRPAPPARAKVDETELAAATGGGRTSHAAAPAAAVEASPPSVAKLAVKSAATPAATPSTGAGAVVQIGAFSSLALSDKGYADVAAALPERMAGKAKHVLPVQKDDATLYRTWLSGFASRSDAIGFCEALRAKGMSCFVRGG